jgi:transposase
MSKRSRVFSRKFKLAAVRRMMAGENVSALSQELRVLRKDLYLWRTHFRAGGPEALRGKGRPRKVAVMGGASPKPAGRTEDVDADRQRIAELERKIGQQQVDLDFFRQALRQVEAARRRSAALGARPSTASSKR